MNFNRNFNPNVWETPRQQHTVQPFANNQQQQNNFFPNQGNSFNPFQPSFNNFQQNQNNIRPLLSLVPSQDHQPHNFRNFKNNNNNQDSNYRRPGPKCSRNNNYGNQSRAWNNNRNDFNHRDNRDTRSNESSESHGSMRNTMFCNDPPPPPLETTEPPKEKSIVDLLKAVQNSKKSEAPQGDKTRVDPMDAICAKNASEAPQRLLTQLRTMDKDGVKDLINNPKQPYKKKVINFQAREKLREQMRKKLKILGSEAETDFQLEPDECIDYERIPESLIAQIGHTLDLNIDGEDMELSESMNEDLEVVKTNLGHDFLMGSEMLLMNGFSLLAETDTEPESKVFDEKMPPLPTEHVEKPPSPPPEPVAMPQILIPPPTPVFSSIDKPWSPIPARPVVNRLAADDWDFDGDRNPDPPEFRKAAAPVPSVPVKIKNEKDEKKDPVKSETVVPVVEKPSSVVNDRPASFLVDRPPSSASGSTVDQATEQPAESGQRANETYGEYRRRLATERDASRETNESDRRVDKADVRSDVRPQQDKFKQENQRKNWNEDDRNKLRNQPGPRDKWLNNNRRNNPNDSGPLNRKTRFDLERERDQERNNNFQQRSTNSAFDNARNIKTEPDGHNYRFQKDNKEPDINQLNSMMNPKPLQFSGSFNKRTQQTGRSRSQNRAQNSRKSPSREQTPVNNSMERGFDVNIQAPLNDARPCLATLRKVMEIDTEMGKIHDKIHGIDKVISNLQLERVSYQKSFARLQHDRKVLFDNLMKRATSSANETSLRSEKSNSNEPVTPVTSQQSQIEKKLQNIVEQKKRKPEEQDEEQAKKKTASAVLETTSAAEKAAKLQKQREEEERKKNLAEKKRLKRLRREREEVERARLDEKIRLKATATTVTTIKIEPRDKSTDRHSDKSKSNKAHHAKEKPVKEVRKFIFSRDEAIDPDSHKMKELSLKLPKVYLGQELVERYKSNGYLNIAVSDWENWTAPVKMEIFEAEEEINGKEETNENEKELEPPAEAKTPEAQDAIEEDFLVIQDVNEDPLAFEDNNSSPPTPGSSFTANEDSMLVEIPSEQDYSEWTGNFGAHDQPIVYLQVVLKQYIVCAAESGKLYKYHTNGDLLAVFSKHSGICNSFLYNNKNGTICTASSDGFLYQIKFKSFQIVDSENFSEALQAIEKSKIGVYVATKAGRIYKLKGDTAKREEEPICNLGTMVLCMRAAKEGARNILLVSSRAHAIQVRDAADGLLLRTLSEDLANVSIYDMLIDGSTIYCGSNRHEIFSVDFTTGALKKKSRPCGAGAICVKLYKNFLIAACYDGNIYIFNTDNDDDAITIAGPSNMLLAMDLWDDKIIASTKDKTLKIIKLNTDEEQHLKLL